ncbi:MAG: FAD-dependent oxidoreductase [Thermoguttaceae bacterium]|nr:FAD-dependent oxidoreductase [Thermoguttaceae bacterium]
MRKILSAFILTALVFGQSIFNSSFTSPVCADETVYDVVVYGGSSAGVAAAVQAKRMGKTAVIVCPDVHLGGLSSAGLGATDSGNRAVIGGISREFYHRLWKHYQKPEAWTWTEIPNYGMPGQGGRGFDNKTQTAWVFEPHVAEMVFEDFVKENDIPVFRGRYLDRMKKDCVQKDGTQIVSIRMKNGEIWRGKTFIDATYEGDLLAAAGVSYTLGRESNETYGETLNGIQVAHAHYHQFNPYVDPYIIPGKPESGLLPYVNETIGKDGDGDTRMQAYCYRLCMTKIPENRVPFTKPENYDPLTYELFVRSVVAGQRFLMINSQMPNGKTDTNNGGPFSHDFIGQNYDYVEADDEEREKICLAHELWQRGLMWTLQNDPRIPADVQNAYKDWGLAKDEFADTRHFGHKIYVREGRRMVSDYVHTELHCRRIEPTPRPIGFGSYTMDSHHCQRYVRILEDGRAVVWNEGDVEVSPRGAYPIDFGTIVPKRSECTNLLVPVCVSSSHIAYGSIRMEPVFMILGQSAATAASMAIDENLAVQDVNYEKLAARLKADAQVIDYPLAPPSLVNMTDDRVPGIYCSDENAKLEGDWHFNDKVSPRIGKGYHHDDGTKCGTKKATYTLDIPKAGEYDVRLIYVPLSNRATNVPVEVHTADGVKTLTVNQQKCGHTPFQSIGTFRFEAGKGKAKIVISNKNVNGHVLLDGVQLLAK